MIDPEKLDPNEVLKHLKHLGYKNVTALQLKEFMHDLRKLIKYDQKYARNLDDVSHCEDSSVSSCSHEERSESESSSEGCQDSSINSSDLCSNCNAFETASVSDISSISSPYESDVGKKKSPSLGQQPIRPKSSFIRPWRLQPSLKPSALSTSLKSDPVQLYHKYKELWAQHKVPGEKSHSQLRWAIREKMLGQDPQPRPISQASSECRSRSMYCK